MNLFQSQIGSVERNINGMLQYQSFSRSSEARDHALLIDNNRYVQNWSIIQIVVILLTCSIQVSYSAIAIHRYLMPSFTGHIKISNFSLLFRFILWENSSILIPADMGGREFKCNIQLDECFNVDSLKEKSFIYNETFYR